MKKTKRFALAIMACLMSAMVMAGNRQVSTALPAQTPSVTVTLDGKQHVVKPTKAYRQLKAISTSDSRHARQAAELIKHFK